MNYWTQHFIPVELGIGPTNTRDFSKSCFWPHAFWARGQPLLNKKLDDGIETRTGHCSIWEGLDWIRKAKLGEHYEQRMLWGGPTPSTEHEIPRPGNRIPIPSYSPGYCGKHATQNTYFMNNCVFLWNPRTWEALEGNTCCWELPLKNLPGPVNCRSSLQKKTPLSRHHKAGEG